jgi:TadE-like protein
MRRVLKFMRDRSGAAGAEMALVIPLLMTIMFGSFELGNYFWTEHKLVKSVRDAARFAARQPTLYSPTTCTAGEITAAPAPTIDNVARYGKVVVDTSVDQTIIPGWDTAVTVELSCPEIGTYEGIYAGKDDMPIVSVSATVDYVSLFQTVGFDAVDIEVAAASQAAVMGI